MIPFKEMPKTARVWIYQSNTFLTTEMIEKITNKIEQFIENWNNHGENLKASFEIKHHHFIVLTVDENIKEASGCSIDASVQLMKQLERDFNIDLFNKLNISFKDNENINIVSMQDFKKYAKENKITNETIVFNNLVDTIEKYESNWEIKAQDSWHSRFLN